MVGERPETRGGSRAEDAGAAQPLGRGDVLTPTVVERVEVEEVGRLGDHLLAPFGGAGGRLHAFDESRWFDFYRTHPTLVKQKLRKSAMVLVTVR